MTTQAGELLVLGINLRSYRCKEKGLELEMAECTGWNLDRPGTGGARRSCSRWKGDLVPYEGARSPTRVHARNAFRSQRERGRTAAIITANQRTPSIT